MTAPAQVPALETGVVRVFALDDALTDEIARSDTLHHLCDALGVAALNHADVQIVDLRTLADMGLTAFLRQGYDIDAAQIAPHAATLDGLTGTVAILRSGAFGGKPATLAATGAARLVATLFEPGTDAPAPFPHDFESTRGTLGPAPAGKPVSDAAMSGRVAMIALLVLFAIAALMVWVAA